MPGHPNSDFPQLKVTCAIIVQNDLVLCTQRSASMSLPLKWEFPGGKLEPGEAAAACIVREIKEELNLEISLVDQGPAFYSPYKVTGELELLPFVCRLEKGPLKVLEHAAVRWCNVVEMENLDWAEADIAIKDWWRANRLLYMI